MGRGPTKPPHDPMRTARYREAARDIVAKDRRDRRNGFAVDTAGAIRRAMERAFAEGFAAYPQATMPSKPHEESCAGLIWALIPPRPRLAFWRICLRLLDGDGRPSANGGMFVTAITPRGTPGWTNIDDGGSADRAIGDASVSPLVRLGLLRVEQTPRPHIAVTRQGQETWARFCAEGGRYPDDLTETARLKST